MTAPVPSVTYETVSSDGMQSVLYWGHNFFCFHAVLAYCGRLSLKTMVVFYLLFTPTDIHVASFVLQWRRCRVQKVTPKLIQEAARCLCQLDHLPSNPPPKGRCPAHHLPKHTAHWQTKACYQQRHQLMRPSIYNQRLEIKHKYLVCCCFTFYWSTSCFDLCEWIESSLLLFTHFCVEREYFFHIQT